MTAAGQVLAGMRVTAAMIQGVAPNAAYKSVAQSVTNSLALVNDTALFLALPASTTWIFTGCLYYNGASGGGLNFGFTVPSLTVLTAESSYWFNTTTLASGTPSAVVFASSGATRASITNGTGATLPVAFSGAAATAGTAGNLQLIWTQSSLSTTATTVMAGSWIAAWQIA